MPDIAASTYLSLQGLKRANVLQRAVVSYARRGQFWALSQYHAKNLTDLECDIDVDTMIKNAAVCRTKASLDVWEAALCIRSIERLYKNVPSTTLTEQVLQDRQAPLAPIFTASQRPSMGIVESAQGWAEGIGNSLRAMRADPRQSQPNRMRLLRAGRVPSVFTSGDDVDAFTRMREASENVVMSSVAQIDAFLLRATKVRDRKSNPADALKQIAIVQQHIDDACGWRDAYAAVKDTEYNKLPPQRLQP